MVRQSTTIPVFNLRNLSLHPASLPSATNTNMTIGGSDWLLVNLRTSGFYRVNYDQENWERLLAMLDTNHQVVGVT